MFVARLNRFSGFGAFSGQVPQQFPRMETVRCSANPLESSGMHPENTSAPSDMQRMRFPNLKAGAGLWGGRLGASDTPAFLITQGRFQEWKQPDADFSWQELPWAMGPAPQQPKGPKDAAVERAGAWSKCAQKGPLGCLIQKWHMHMHTCRHAHGQLQPQA